MDQPPSRHRSFVRAPFEPAPLVRMALSQSVVAHGGRSQK